MSEDSYSSEEKDGCDFEHWLITVEKPKGEPTRDEIIDSYINTLAIIVGSYDEARMKIYSVSTRCYYAFGALMSANDYFWLEDLPGVISVEPDSYVNIKKKVYGGEPFIDGMAVPYDPKYHKKWIRDNARENERKSRNDRRRNFKKRKENMQATQPPSGNMGTGLRSSYNGGSSNTGSGMD